MKINSEHPTAMQISADTAIERLINEHELSRITSRSVPSIRRDRLHGKGCRYVKLGNLVRYRPSDVREYIEANLRIAASH